MFDFHFAFIFFINTNTINNSTPFHRYYSPGYSDALLERVEQYKPS